MPQVQVGTISVIIVVGIVLVSVVGMVSVVVSIIVVGVIAVSVVVSVAVSVVAIVLVSVVVAVAVVVRTWVSVITEITVVVTVVKYSSSPGLLVLGIVAFKRARATITVKTAMNTAVGNACRAFKTITTRQ